MYISGSSCILLLILELFSLTALTTCSLIINLLCVVPLLKFALFPFAEALLRRLCVNDAPISMLHTVDPIALILAPIRVGVRPKAMLLIELVVAFVATPILPHISTMAMHHSTLELALEVSTIGPLKATSTTHLILGPIACILTSIGPEVNAFALFLAIVEASQVVAAITPHLNAFAILLVGHEPVGVRLGAELALPVEVVDDIVLAEDAQVGLLVLLPDALENLVV